MIIIAGGGGRLALIDFTECEIDLMANYGGSDKKRGILYNGKRYMLKMSDKIPEEKQNSLNETVSIPQLSWGNNRCKWR